MQILIKKFNKGFFLSQVYISHVTSNVEVSCIYLGLSFERNRCASLLIKL